MFLAWAKDMTLHFQDLMYKFRIGCYECAELLQGQEGRPVPYHIVKDEVSKATVVLWGCVVDKMYDLKYPSKRWIHWRLLRENWLKVFKSGAKFVFCQLLQVFQVVFFGQAIHSGMDVEWEIEDTFGSYIDALVPIQVIVSGVTVTYQFADQVGIILRQFDAFGNPFLQTASASHISFLGK